MESGLDSVTEIKTLLRATKGTPVLWTWSRCRWPSDH